MTTLTRILRIQIPMWFFLPLFAIAMAAGSVAGFTTAQRSLQACPLEPQTCAGLSSFWKAWDLLSRYYVDQSALDPKKMTDGAIAGMADSLGDSGHTRYLSPEVAKAERESLNGAFEGIGAYIDIRDGQPLIISPIEGSPAEKAGIKAGDLILQVDQRDVHGISVDELLSLVRGPRGTKVTLLLQRIGQTEPLEISVMRDTVNVPAVSWRMLSDQIADIRITQFSAQAGAEMRKALAEAKAQGAKAIVLDLRDNPGGYVEQLRLVAGEFMPTGTTVLIEQDRDGKQNPYTTREGGTALDIPLVVLVNQNSASSAEILAGALSEAGRAQVIGMPTFGTATVLQTYPLDNGGELRIGTQQWLTPKGELVRGKGIRPTEEVDLPAGKSPLSPAEAAALDVAGLQASGDTQLLRALEILRGKD